MSSVPEASRGDLAPSAKCLIPRAIDPSSGCGTELPILFQALIHSMLPHCATGTTGPPTKPFLRGLDKICGEPLAETG
jgi:hypothetical protein